MISHSQINRFMDAGKQERSDFLLKAVRQAWRAVVALTTGFVHQGTPHSA
jgi:hypothetical protein